MTYSRSQAPLRRKLEQEILNLYGATSTHTAHVYPSGMTAISGAISAIVDERLMASNPQEGSGKKAAADAPPFIPITIVHGDELYCDVFRTVKRLVAMHMGRVRAEGVSIRDHAKIIKVFQDAAKGGAPVGIFHFEACTNPSSEVFDFSIIPALRKLSPNCVFICDNTWLTGWQLNPLLLGADVVVESMTKYVSGGTCIGGYVVAPSKLSDAMWSWIATYGIFVGDDHCRLFINGIYSLRARMEAIAVRIIELARFLEVDCSNAIGRVLHPSRPSHPSRKLAAQYSEQMGQMDFLCPGVMYVHILASRNQVGKAAQGLKDGSILEMKTSFGGNGSRIDPWSIVKGNSDRYDEGAAKGGGGTGSKDGTWIRIAVGCADDSNEVKSAFAHILSKLSGKPVAGADVVVAPVTAAPTAGGGPGPKPPNRPQKKKGAESADNGEEAVGQKEGKKKKSRLQ